MDEPIQSKLAREVQDYLTTGATSNSAGTGSKEDDFLMARLYPGKYTSEVVIGNEIQNAQVHT